MYFLGVDGGQSSTTALLADESGRVLGMGSGGPCNHVKSAAEGREKFCRVIGGAIAAAATAANLHAEELSFTSACLGFSGGPADKVDLLREMLATKHLTVTTDAHIALAGAHGGGRGIITIAGTGHISLGRGPDGRISRAGGWGYLFGDEGGGFWIACQAVRAAMRQHEGWGPATALHDRMLAATGFADANTMMHAFYTADWPRPRVAALSRLVDEAAAEGDAEATAILTEGARQLLAISTAVRRTAFGKNAPADLAPIGSVWQSQILRERFVALWLADQAGNRFTPPRYGPAAGALLEAFREAGTVVTLSNVPGVEK